MKKGLYAILAVLTVFAMVMVSCDDGSGKTDGEKVIITFNQNYDGAPKATTKEIDKGAAIGTLPAPTRTDFTLDGWYKDAAGTGSKITSADKFDADTTVYAKWTPGGGPGPITLYPLPAGAIELGDFTWVNNDNQKGWKSNGMDNEDTDVSATDITTAQYLVLDLSAAPTGGLQFVWQGDAAGPTWPWNQTGGVLSDSGVPDAEKGAVITTNGDVTVLTIEISKVAKDYEVFQKNSQVKILIAYYTGGIDGLGLARAYLTGSLDVARAEKVELQNAWYAVYRFELPAGKTWQDYKELSASYMFTAADLAVATSRNGRLMGPYGPSDFGFVKGNGDADGINLAVASYNNGKNAPFILDNGKLGQNNDDGILVKELSEKYGINAVGGQWFTMTYDISGKSAHSGFVASNKPADTATGPFYFGVGLPGNNNEKPANKQYIRDVTLVGYVASDNVVATPLWLEQNGARWPAYTGYPSANGNDGFGAASRRMADGSNPAAVLMGEKIELQNAWYAVYKFDLPTGATWQDYKELSASYMFTAENLAVATSRNGRLMGPYSPSDFGFVEGNGDADGIKVMVASYNNGKNAPFILDNGKLSQSNDDGILVKELSEKYGINAVGGQWFTMTYDIKGGNKHSGFVADNMPADTATGPFYFGVGLPGNNNDKPANKFSIKDVKLVSYDGTVDVIATPAYLADPAGDAAVLYPVYTGYPTASGGDGFAAASRTPIK